MENLDSLDFYFISFCLRDRIGYLNFEIENFVDDDIVKQSYLNERNKILSVLNKIEKFY